jgi:hypothetical protein
MKKLFSILLVVFFSTTIFSQTIVSIKPANKNVILEEFTGTKCSYCPDGHKVAQGIMTNNPGRAWSINIHQGAFSGSSPNYKTVWGDALAAQYGVNSWPAATVSRGATWSSTRSQWVSWANSILAQPSCLNVAAKGTLDWKERKLTLLVEVYYTGNAVQSTNKLNVAMLQNEVLGPQEGASIWYPEMMAGSLYRHQHMLRDFITGQWGMDISSTTEGTFFTHTFEYDVPENFNNVKVALANVEFLVFVSENQKTIISGSLAEITHINKCFSITSTAEYGGTISPLGNFVYDPDECPEYTIIPKPGYIVRLLYVDNQSVGVPEDNKYTFAPLDNDHTINVVFKKGTEVKDVNGVVISVYPNPVNDQLFVTGEYDKLEIFSLSGQLITTTYNQPSVDVNHLANGVYFVEIESNGQTATFKVVK